MKFANAKRITTLFIILTVGFILCNCEQNEGYDQAPIIKSFSPTYGLPGELITITGTGLHACDTEYYSVTIDGERATILDVSETELKFTVPSSALTGNLMLSMETGHGSSGNFEVWKLGAFEVLKDIPRTGLVAFYPFKGNADDISGNKLNGLPTNGPALVNDRFKKVNAAYAFDGVDDFISVGNPSPLKISNRLTIGGWINLNAEATKKKPIAVMPILSKMSDLYTDPEDNLYRKGYMITAYIGVDYKSAYNFIPVVMSSNGNALIDTEHDGEAEFQFPENEWVFFSLVIDDKHYRFYQNDRLLLETRHPLSAVNLLADGSLGDFLIGTGFPDSAKDFFVGKMDDVSIYNRALSSEEINQLYQQTVTKY